MNPSDPQPLAYIEPVVLDDGFRALVTENLRRFERQPSPTGDWRAAAVAIALVAGEESEPAFLLTRRSRELRRHPGQWALPGGRLDAGETVATAALRELEEELGVSLPDDSVLGLLDDYATRSGFLITPVVVWGGGVVEVTPNAGEVAEVHRVPVDDLGKPGLPHLRSIEESDRPAISIPMAGTHVHAPTAAILYQLHEVAVLGRSTRVDHYEAPVWAWH